MSRWRSSAWIELLARHEAPRDEDLTQLTPRLACTRARVLLRLPHSGPVLCDDLRELGALDAEPLDEDLAELLAGFLLQLERDDELALGHEPALDEKRADQPVGDSLRKGHLPVYRPSLERARGSIFGRCGALESFRNTLCCRGARARAYKAASRAYRGTERPRSPPVVREDVLDPGRASIDHPSLEQPRVLQLEQALGEGPGRDLADRLLDLVEAARPFDGRPQDRDRPASLEEARRAADLLGDGRAALTARHGAATTALPRARSRGPRRATSPGGTPDPPGRAPARRRGRRGSARGSRHP